PAMRQRDELSVIGAAGYRLNRRRLLRAAAASGMAALGLIPSTIRPGRFVRADTTINVLAPQWPQGPKEQALAEEWSKQSGIAVTFDAVNYANLEQRVKLLVDGESTDYDIYDYDSQWIGGFVQAGALERLDTPDYLGASGVAIRMGDFFPEITSRLCQYPAAEPNAQSSAPSPVYGLPWSLNCEVLWYRTDLMDAPPASWDDLRIQAKALTTSDVFGYATEGGRDADWIISEFAPIAWSNGGQLWDPATYTADGNLNSGQNAASLKFLADMVNGDKSIDPASANWTITERLGALLTGKAAMCLNWSPLFGGVADDTTESQVAGRVGYALSPKGSAGQAALFGCQGTGINAYSQHKAEAWQYLQFLQSKETQAALMEDAPSGFVSARNDLRETATLPWQKVFLDSIPHLRDIWNLPEYAQLLQILQTELNLAYVGQKDPQKALDDAAQAQQQVLDSSPGNPKNATPTA
ncbi:MAG TPA: sugar ABC transporter substrate-binding protein, partial [Thermomicrobiales bacterium]|nr:sugar ABC transporter substrate-binding protein [Thermomicrobiales bacterium]